MTPDLRDSVLHTAAPIAIVVVTAVVVTWGGRRLIERTQRRLEDSASAPETISLQRRATVARVAVSGLRIIVWTAAVLLILASLDVNIQAVLTTAGLAGLAVAFGAQNAVRDFVAGFFIVSENQYDVGDRVELDIDGEHLEGWVRAVSFRSTQLELDGGMVSTVPNASITYAINHSRGRGELTFTVKASHEHSDEVRERLDLLSRELTGDRGVARMVFGGPRVDKIVSDGHDVYAFRLETRPERRREVEEALTRRLRDRIEDIPDAEFASPT